MGQDSGRVDVFLCGGSLCKDDQPHVWDGPEVSGDTENGGGWSSGTCSKCGMTHMDWCLWNISDEDWIPTRWDHLQQDSLAKEEDPV